MKILKFGGSTLRDAERIQQVVQLIEQARAEGPIVVVLSALYGVTDALLRIAAQAESQLGAARDALHQVLARHIELSASLLPDEESVEAVKEDLQNVANDHAQWLEVIAQKGLTLAVQDAFIALGEKLSVRLLGGVLRAHGVPAQWWDADQQLVATNEQFGHAEVDLSATREQIAAARSRWNGTLPLITGFIGHTPQGQTTTLGRDGSDYTAAILGAILEAEQVDIWTDVDGVLTADPEVVPDARLVQTLTYREAAELAWFGARVLHPKTIHPLQEKSIPLYIKNVARPAATGTRIQNGYLQQRPGVRCVVGKSGLAEVTIAFHGMLDHDNLLSRLYRIFHDVPHQVFLNDLGAPNHGVRLLVNEAASERLLSLIQAEFQGEIRQHRLEVRRKTTRKALVTLVGSELLTRLQLPEQLQAILRQGVRGTRIFSFGNSETHVALVVPEDQFRPVMQRLHNRFFQQVVTIHLAIAGPTGNVGQQLLQLIAEEAATLRQQYNIQFQVVGAINRRQMVLNPTPVADVPAALTSTEALPAEWDQFIDTLIHSHNGPLIFVDVTASATVAHHYLTWLENHVAVVTANKLGISGPQPIYQQLQETARNTHVPLLYSTTVGAGTPFIQLLRNFRERGEEVVRLEGALSGTLAFVFQRLNQGIPFSEAVREANQRGFTEPHPGVDLQGLDVARKLLILLRELGFRLEMKDIVVESLVPESWVQQKTTEEFLTDLAQLDAEWHQRVETAHQQNQRLIYLALFDGHTARVGVHEVPEADYLRWPAGEGNQLRVYTRRFATMPLLVEGPGAGPRFTAMGVYRDLVAASIALLQLAPLE